MAKGIVIGIASETGAYEKGLRAGVIAPTEDAVEQLEQLGKTDGPEDLAKSMGEAQTASHRLKKEIKDTADSLEQDFRRGYRKLKESSDDGTRRAIAGMNDLKDESKQSLKETASSIRSVEDGLDAVQEIAANAFVGFGPAGFVAGSIAATGIGLVTSAFQTAQQAASDTKRRIAEMYQAAVEEGKGFIDEAQIQAAVIEIIFGENQDAYNQARLDARNLGIDSQTVIRAMAGDQEALNQVLARTAQLQDEYKQKLDESNTPMQLRATLASGESERLGEINQRYQTQKDILDENKRKATEYLASQEAAGEVIRANNKALADAPKVIPVKVVADTTEIDQALQRRTLRIDIEGYTRDGNRVV